MLNFRNFSVALILLLFMSVISACNGESGETGASSSDSDIDTIKIGALLPSSGVYASLGKNLNRGMELYFDSIDFEVDGKKIEIIIEDTEADAQVSLRKLRKLIEQDEIDILTGTISTAVAYAIRDEVDSRQIPFLVSHFGENALTRENGSDYILRSSFSSWQIGNSLGEWAYENVGEKIYLIAADYAFGHEATEAFKNAFEEAGGMITDEVYPELGNTDYASYLTSINNSDADAVYGFFAGSDAINFVNQYEEYGLNKKMPLLGSGWLVSEDVRPEQGTASEGINASTFWDYALDNEENVEFVQSYEKMFDDRPSIESLEGYDAARIITETIQSLNGEVSDPDAFVEAMAAVEFMSPRGPIKFDQDTNHIIQNMYIIENEIVDDRTENKIVETIESVQDPGK